MKVSELQEMNMELFLCIIKFTTMALHGNKHMH
jgi:hypothetical protein